MCRCRSQRPCDLKRRSAAARLLRTLVRIPPEEWMFVSCDCCVAPLSGSMQQVQATQRLNKEKTI